MMKPGEPVNTLLTAGLLTRGYWRMARRWNARMCSVEARCRQGLTIGSHVDGYSFREDLVSQGVRPECAGARGWWNAGKARTGWR
jgi:hypothetical protein